MIVRYKQQATIFFMIIFIAYGIVVITVAYIQFYQHDFFVNLGKRQYMMTITTMPARAAIVDRSGNLLAMNQDTIAAFIVPKKLSDPGAVQLFLKKHFPGALQRLEKNISSHFMYIARRLTPEQLNMIHSAHLADIQLLNEPSRYYPVACANPIIGLTDIDNKGIFGVELLFNDQLAGKPTTCCLEKDARSHRFYFKRNTTNSGQDGAPLTLTLDSALQFLVYEELKATVEKFNAKQGAVIVMNPRTGALHALATYPCANPYDTAHLDLEHINSSIITQEYEFGSVLKAFTTLAALEEGVVTLDELIDCELKATTYVDGRKVNTVQSSVAGTIPFIEVIAKSNNIGIAKVAKRLGPKLYDHLLRMGFGKKTGIEFPGERSGFVNHPSRWSKQSLFSLSYGYEITATLLQIAQAFSLVANKGYLVHPTLIMPVREQSFTHTPLYSAQAIEALRKVLEYTVLQGTAQKARIKGYTVLSKTGTANLLVDGVYDPAKNIYTCGGIIEKGAYQRVIVAFIKEGNRKNLYASTVAAPLFERVAEKTVILDKIV